MKLTAMSNPAPQDNVILADVVYRGGLNRKYLRPQDLRRLSHADFSSRRAIEGLYSGRHKTFQRGQSIEFRDYRQYLPGDEINHIDWKVFGRTDKLFIKLFEHQADLNVHLLVDGSNSMFFTGFDRGQQESKLDCSCRMAAAIGFLVTKQHDLFSFAFAQDGLSRFQRPASNIRHLMQVLDVMESVRAVVNAQLPDAISSLIQHSRKRDLLCVFSDLLDDQTELLKKFSVWLQRGGEIIVFHVLHNHEIELPEDLGAAMFIDSESRESTRADTPAIRKNYRDKMKNFVADWGAQCRKLGVDYNLVKVQDSYIDILQKYFAKRQDRLSARTRSANLKNESDSADSPYMITE